MNFVEAGSPLLEHLLSIARRILRDEAMAWDALQEALVSLWIQDVMPSNVHAWLACTVAHRSLHLARCQSRRRRHEFQAGVQRAKGNTSEDPSHHLEAEELVEMLDEALARISPDHRVVLELSSVEQLDYEAIASRLQIPLGTVRSRINRARRALGAILTQILPEEYLVRPTDRPGHFESLSHKHQIPET
jgi:RNA polymerase sigma-70 factor, ECF subfamily